MVDYKKMLIILIQNNISKSQLCKMADISPSTFTKFNKNKLVSMETLIRICRVLNCDFGDIVEIVKWVFVRDYNVFGN